MHDKNTGMDAVSHNADHAARKAAMQERARMAIEGRRSAVGCGHTQGVEKPATEAVSAQKNGKHDGECAVNYDAEFLGAGSRTGKVLVQVRPRRSGGRNWTDVTHTQMMCGVEQMMDWVNTYGDKRNHYRVIDRVETTLLAPAEMLPERKKPPPSTH